MLQDRQDLKETAVSWDLEVIKVREESQEKKAVMAHREHQERLENRARMGNRVQQGLLVLEANQETQESQALWGRLVPWVPLGCQVHPV